MPKAVQVINLIKIFSGGVRAVDDISFQIEEGDFFGFLGPNGAGKTTTMRTLATLTRPTSGRVIVNGFDVLKQPDEVRRSIGFAMQAVGLDDLASAWENLQLMGVLYGLSRTEARKRAEELLHVLQLEKAADRFVVNYSGGMRRRLDVAVALMHRPRILFLDEPTEGLDPAGRRIIWAYLQSLNQEGTTVFLTTHYMEEADHLTRNLAIMSNGKIVAEGSPQALKGMIGGQHVDIQTKDREKARQAVGLENREFECRLTDKGIEVTVNDGERDFPRIIKLLSEAKIEMEGFSLHSPSLEDAFMEFAGHTFEDEELGKGADPYVMMRRRGR